MRMMRGQVSPVDIGNTPEDALFYLQSRAREYADELIAEFKIEARPGVRAYLLELIAEAKSVKALSVLAECLRSDENDLWGWAIKGLCKLDTREARKVLWEARTYTKATEEATKQFRLILGSPNSESK